MSTPETTAADPDLTDETTDTDSTQASKAEAAAAHQNGRLTNDGEMDRITVRMPDEMLAAVEEAVETGRYANRTVAIRDAVRERFMRGGRR